MHKSVNCARCQKCGLTRVEAEGHPTTFWSSFLLNNPTSKASAFTAAIAWARICRHATENGATHPDCLVSMDEVANGDALKEINRIERDLDHGTDGTAAA